MLLALILFIKNCFLLWEQPANSKLERMPPFQWLAASTDIVRMLYRMGDFGAPTEKLSALYAFGVHKHMLRELGEYSEHVYLVDSKTDSIFPPWESRRQFFPIYVQLEGLLLSMKAPNATRPVGSPISSPLFP